MAAMVAMVLWLLQEMGARTLTAQLLQRVHFGKR